MADGGYAPRVIDTFTLADVRLLLNRWASHPPVRVMVAAYLGIKSADRAAPAGAVTSVAAIRAQFPDGLMRG